MSSTGLHYSPSYLTSRTLTSDLSKLHFLLTHLSPSLYLIANPCTSLLTPIPDFAAFTRCDLTLRHPVSCLLIKTIKAMPPSSLTPKYAAIITGTCSTL
eukprot:CAMPEP_0168339250 /NCGR_PEP_ID=MMETSP0213-20121227/13348_1 /TAXON_ID=151035 /ORGANISM="Euplotes harpa, Strain FSP1.4" /LENGTH=98 /DNA_ID=CAMNT_0008345243 /DNA_START=12 /DNA_END=308 /DNA_ORIENTATION=+